VRPIANRTSVWLLQHPDETGHPKNTGELLNHSLNASRLYTVEQAAPAELAGLELSHAALLYPPAAGVPACSACEQNAIKHLVVIDATWRKSRKMLHLNPWLAALPRFSLAAPPPGRYRIRSAARQDQLSTFEASCYALQQIEGDPTLGEQALAAFDDYINHLVSFDPNRR
jgi:DTW domain-containing protein YfiP